MTAKNIIITGVSRGLGRAFVGEFATMGHVVAGCGRSQAAMHELGERFSSPHSFTALDIADDSAVQSWAARVMHELGPPDLLVCNAALINQNAPLWEVSPEEFRQLIDVNINGVHSTIRAFVPAMIDRRSGVIVTLSSGWGRSVSAEVAPYCASKWAIEGLTKALAQELPSGMAAIPMNPGVINTDMLQSCFGGSASSYRTAEEWAKTAAPFLLELGERENGVSVTAP